MTNNYIKHCLAVAMATVALFAAAATARAQVKTAYGLLRYDEEQVRIPNSFVSFPLQDKGTFQFKRFFGDSSNQVTAGAYADGYYYVARAATIMDSEGTSSIVPTDLLRYDIDNDEYTVVGNIVNTASVIYDMTYDHSTDMLYAISYDQTEGGSELLTIDTRSGRAVKVGEVMKPMFWTLACSYDGQLYGVNYNGNVCKINKDDATTEELFGTGLIPEYAQTMEFDHNDGKLYWIGNAITEVEGTAVETDFLTEVDLENKRLNLIGNLGSSPQVAGLYIPFTASQPGTPDAASDLKVLADAKGALKATLNWTVPTQTYDKQQLTDVTKVEIYRNHAAKPVKTFTGVKPGEAMSWTDETMTENRNYTYVVYVYNATGRGAEAKGTAFVGHDTPKAPKDLKLTKVNSQKVELSWDIDELGTRGGFVDHSSLTYTVKRFPDNKTLAEGLTDTHITDTDLSKAQAYRYSVQAVNADAKSDTVATADMVLGPTDNIPVSYDFGSCPKSWTMVDADNDSYGWVWADKETGRTISHQGSNMKESDDWLISYYLEFEQGKQYAVTVDAQTFSPNHVDFYLLKDMNYNAPAQKLNSMDIPATQHVKGNTFVFTAQESGVFSLALHATSAQNAYLLDLYGLSIKEANNNDLAVVALNGPTRPFIGKKTTYQLVVENQGRKTAYGFKAVLTDQDGNELKSLFSNKSLKFGERATVDLEWSPNTAVTKLVGKLGAYNGFVDDNLDNNVSDTISVKPRANYDGSLVPIPSSPTTYGWYAPFALNTDYSAAQAIYSSSEVGGKAARIDRIAWMFDNDGSKDVTNVTVKVYMANTDMTENNAWIPEADYKLVYDGPLNVPATAADEITVELQSPFQYEDGKNLAVLTTSAVADEGYHNFFWWASYKKGQGLGARVWYSQALDKDPFDWTRGGYQDTDEGRTPSVMLYLTEGATAIGSVTADMGSASYELFTTDGKKVGEGKLAADGSLPTAAVKNGVYVVKATKNGTTQTMKVSVNK